MGRRWPATQGECVTNRLLLPTIAALALGLILPAQGQEYPTARTVLSSGTTVTEETIRYPAGGAAKVNAVIITVAPGTQTGWHRHGVPLFAYMLAGELTVDYGAKGKRTYKTGDGFLEAMDSPHNGHNAGSAPVSILVVYMGAEGAPEVLPEK